jgi:hypothetical protein
MIKQISTNHSFILGLVIGMASFSGISSPSEAITIATNHEDDDSQVNYMAELALTIINYDHHRNIATNLDLSILNFSEEERQQLALELNPSLLSPQLVATAPQSLTDGLNMLLTYNSADSLSNILEPGYLVSNIEVVTSPSSNENQQKNNIATLPQTESDDIYDSVYEFDIAVQQEDYTLLTGIGQMLANNSQSAQSTQESPTSAPDNSQVTLTQVASNISSVARSRASRGSSWMEFFEIGEQIVESNRVLGTLQVEYQWTEAGSLTGSGEFNYVQNQLALQQASRENIQLRTEAIQTSGFSRPLTSTIPKSTIPKFKY